MIGGNYKCQNQLDFLYIGVMRVDIHGHHDRHNLQNVLAVSRGIGIIREPGVHGFASRHANRAIDLIINLC